MIPFLKKYWLAIVLVAVGLFFFLSGSLDSCSSKHSDTVIEAVDEAALRRHLIDSLKTESAAIELLRIDSVQKIGQKKVSALKKEVSRLEKERDELAAAFYRDTASAPDDCALIIAKADSAIKASAQVSDSLKAEVLQQEGLTENEKAKTEQYRGLYLLEKGNYKSAEGNISQLKKELNRQTNWWHRNEKWIYGGLGMVLGILIMK